MEKHILLIVTKWVRYYYPHLNEGRDKSELLSLCIIGNNLKFKCNILFEGVTELTQYKDDTGTKPPSRKPG